MPLNDDPEALADVEYSQLLRKLEETAEPCPDSLPPEELETALARLDADG